MNYRENKIIELVKAGADAEVVVDVNETLKAYTEVCVTRNRGKFDVSASACISNQKNGDDYKVWFIKANDWFSTDEQVENYVNTWLCFPSEYKGKFNYRELNKNAADIRAGRVVAKMVNGNITFKKVA